MCGFSIPRVFGPRSTRHVSSCFHRVRPSELTERFYIKTITIAQLLPLKHTHRLRLLRHDMNVNGVSRAPIYPAYTFKRSPTWFKWVKLTSTDIHGLRVEPRFEGIIVCSASDLTHSDQVVARRRAKPLLPSQPPNTICLPRGSRHRHDGILDKYVLLTIDDGERKYHCCQDQATSGEDCKCDRLSFKHNNLKRKCQY